VVIPRLSVLVTCQIRRSIRRNFGLTDVARYETSISDLVAVSGDTVSAVASGKASRPTTSPTRLPRVG
jgi:hypothetical protein